MPGLKGRRILLVTVLAVLDQAFQTRNPVSRERMADRVGVSEPGGEQLLVLKLPEGFKHAATGLFGLFKIGDRGTVRRGFFTALIGKQCPLRGRCSALDDADASADHVAFTGGRTGGTGRSAKQRGENGDCLGLRQGIAEPGQVPSGNVGGFVGEHADDFVRRFRLHQDADIDEYAATIDDKGVETGVSDQDDVDVRTAEAGRLENRRGITSQQCFCLGIAHQGKGAHLGKDRSKRKLKRSHRKQDKHKGLLQYVHDSCLFGSLKRRRMSNWVAFCRGTGRTGRRIPGKVAHRGSAISTVLRKQFSPVPCLRALGSIHQQLP